MMRLINGKCFININLVFSVNLEKLTCNDDGRDLVLRILSSGHSIVTKYSSSSKLHLNLLANDLMVLTSNTQEEVNSYIKSVINSNID